MVHLQEIQLPEEFLALLKQQGQMHGDIPAKVAKYLEKLPSLKQLAIRSLYEFDPHKKRVENMINNLGWNSFRDRLASVFIKKQLNGKFSFSSDLKIMEDVVEFEERLRKHSVLGMPNCFLIAFYFKFLSLEDIESDGTIKGLSFYPQLEKAFKLMEKLQSRVVQIDWLLIQLMHFCEFIPEQELEHCLGDTSYDELYSGLSTKQKTILLNNLLSYGYAVGDKDTLVPPQEAV